MPEPFDLFGDTAGLPKTVRGELPYETEALTPREVWGHGHGATTLNCRQIWNNVPTWIRYMVGEVEIRPTSSVNRVPQFVRHIPERLRYGDTGGGDRRTQWCTGLSQITQGGNPVAIGGNPATSTARFAQNGTNWPATAWSTYQVTWETTPYWIRSETEVIDMATAANALAGAHELYRYVVRDRKTYSKEQPIPAATSAGGFKVIDPIAVNRKAIGQVGFRVISMGDVMYKWVRVPVGWPPPPGWLVTNVEKPWPPLVNPAVVAPGAIRRTRDSYIGTINSTYFDCADPEGYCWQPEELLYTGYSEYRYFDAAGDRVCDIEFRFKYKEGGWNKFLDARGNWREVSASRVLGDNLAGTPNGRRPYETNDFNNFFQYVAA